MGTELFAVALAILATMLGAPGPVFLKKASKNIGFNLKTITNKYLWLGGIFYLMGISTATIALKYGMLSVIGPVLALTYVWVSFISIKFLNERINTQAWIGISLIITGVIILSLGI